MAMVLYLLEWETTLHFNYMYVLERRVHLLEEGTTLHLNHCVYPAVLAILRSAPPQSHICPLSVLLHHRWGQNNGDLGVL